MVGAGFNECLTMVLSSKYEQYKLLRKN